MKRCGTIRALGAIVFFVQPAYHLSGCAEDELTTVECTENEDCADPEPVCVTGVCNGRLCEEEGWFHLERIAPLQTSFDPEIHRAAGAGRALPGAEGKILEILRVGRLDEEGYRVFPARVLVGH